MSRRVRDTVEMVWRGFLQLEPEEAPYTQRVCRAPSDAPLRIETFEISEKQHPEIAPRRQAWTANLASIEPLAERLDVPVEVGFVQHLIQSRVERVGGTSRQVFRGHP